MARIGNLCAMEKIPGRESTRLNVNDSMVDIDRDLCGRGCYDAVSTTCVQFSSVSALLSHGTIFPISVNHDKIR
jgi:hypothetical protein